ncbi:MAG: transglycosylase SLT domain-containing protein [Pseudomonadota bacterium]
MGYHRETVSLRFLLLVTVLLVAGCTTAPPRDVNDICSIFEDKKGWYDDALDSQKEWGSPIPVMMAIMHQESRFVAKAKPPRKKIFGFIPGPRPSDAYGYSQALGSTWKGYKKSAGRYGADRDDFGDAIDFIGWYNYQSYKRSGIARNDAYRLYLAYHEGQGGYNRGTYRSKDWLLGVARKVDNRAGSYGRRLSTCEDDLKDDGWFFGIF